MYQLLALLVLLCLAGCGERAPAGSLTGEGEPHDLDLALVTITGAGVRAHMEVLASDAMEGREAGTPGYERAADYVAAQFAALDLEPLGDDGGFLQQIRFFETRLDPASAALTLHAEGRDIPLEFRRDFVRSGGYGPAEETIKAPLTFVGYGITAPEYGHDDFAGIDVAGHVLVTFTGAPPHFATDQRAFYSSGRTKAARAVAAGAVGRLSVRTPVDQARRPWARYLPGIGRPGMRWLEASGVPHRAYPELAGSAVLSETGAEMLFAAAGRDLAALFESRAAGDTGSFALGLSATLARRSLQREIESANVIARLPGSDPQLASEHLIYTAHLDHIGIRPGFSGDDIHNGAYDNAAGIGIILEIARAMSAMATPPRRSVIFAAVTAEEKGLQGSSYLAKNPPAPAASLVANFNIDMPFLGFPVADVEAFGAEHSTLLAAVTAATAAEGLALTPDPMPEEVRFVRSDQFSFVQEGVPALAFKAGSKSADPEVDGKAMLSEFLSQHYHRPGDELGLPYSSEGAARFTRAALRLGIMVANADERPRWNDGDFFGEKFAR